MSEPGTWRAVGVAPDGSGLVALEELDAAGVVVRRLAADVRGGVAWPFPKQVGTELVAAGCCCVVAFVPPKAGVDGGAWDAELLRWSACASIVTVKDPHGWPLDQGVCGRLRLAAAELGCVRWYAFAPADEHDEAMRAVRHVLGVELPALRVTSIHEGDNVKAASAVGMRWGVPGRMSMPEAASTEVEREETEYNGKGTFALTLAIGAALRGFDMSPWKARRALPWETLPEGIVNQPLHV